jgi:hypothetical protein
LNQTSDDGVRLAGALFDEVLVPLAAEKRRAGVPAYFPVAPDPGASSYFTPSSVSSMAPADFEFPGGGTPQGLIAALVDDWRAEGETVLASAGPRLTSIAAAVAAAAAKDDGSVDIFCYTLF